MHDKQSQLDREWERVMGRKVTTAAKIPLGLTIDVDGMHVVLDVKPGRDLDQRLIARLLGHGKVPKAKRQQPVKFAALLSTPDSTAFHQRFRVRDGYEAQRAEYDRVMGREQVAA